MNVDQLRNAIDSGKGGDKVPFPDPAAAPLGTDDEAAGTPPSHQATSVAYDHEIAKRPTTKRETPILPMAVMLIAIATLAGAGVFGLLL